MPEKIGLVAVLDTTEFDKGLKTYVGGLGQAESQTERASKSISSLGDIAKTALGVGLGNIAAQGIQRLTGAVTGAVSSIGDMVRGAADIQGVRVAFEALTAAQPDFLSRMQEASAGMIAQRDLMQSYNLAAQLVGKTFADQLPQAMGYLTKVSAATGQSMGYLMDSLVRGVGRLSPMILDNLAIQVDMTAATETYGQEIGKTAEEMTKAEKQAAIMNEVMRQLAINTAAMPDVSGLASAGIAGFTARVQNLRDSIGTALLPALNALITPVNAILDRFSAAISEGGALSDVMTNLGAVASVVGDSLGEMAAVGAESGINFVASLNERFGEAARNALEWGINIVASLADGIIQGAASVLNAAMTWIGNLLAGWLAPGSPPAIVPNIDLWGAETMNEYLQGFSQADFDILEGLQGQIQNVFNVLTQAGVLSGEQAAKAFAEFSEDIAKSLAETGEVGEDIFARLVELAGPFGQEIADLTKAQVQLAKAIENVKKAQDALNKANEAVEAAESDVSRLTREYNELLKAGASDEILKAKLAEINAAESGLDVARKERNEAQKALKEAEKRADPLEEQVKLQERLVKQLLDIAKAQEKARKEAEKAAAAGVGGAAAGGRAARGAGGAAAALPALGAALPTLARGLPAGFEEAKTGIIASLGDLFAPLKERWETSMLPTIQGIADKWTWFTGIVKTFYDEKIKPVIDTIISLIPPTLLENIGKAIGIFLALKVAIAAVGIVIGIVSGALGTLLSPITLIIGAIALLITAWENNWFGIRDTMTDVWENTLKPALTAIWEWLSTNIPVAIETAKTFWDETLKPALEAVWAFITDSLIPAFTAVADWLGTTIGTAIDTAKQVWEEVLKPALETVYNFVNDDLLPLFESVKELFDVGLNLAVTAMAGLWENILKPAFDAVYIFVKDKLQPILDGIQTFFEDDLKPILDTIATLFSVTLTAAWNTFTDVLTVAKTTILDPVKTAFESISTAIQDVKSFIDKLTESLKAIELPDWLKPGSPPPLYFALQDIGNQMRQLSAVELPRLAAELQLQPLGTTPMRQMPTSISSFTQSVQVGPNMIQSGIDVATIEAVVDRAISRRV